MHPTICRFISESVYEKRLHHHTDTCYHQLHLKEPRLTLPSSGITFIPVAHEGNAQSSQEEIEVIEQLIEQILGRSYTSERGKHTASLRPDDILVVAPYNLQVRQLQARLRDRSRIGTVDKFQGHEAPVLIISMCASRGETAPRGLDFLLNPNRLNVALSRAQCLSIVVGSPQLAQTRCANLNEAKLVNVFCKIIQQQFS
jgi:superfamily I DNA and/or RNA helicase